MKLCHAHSKKRIDFNFDTDASESVAAFHSCKTIQRTHEFLQKVNLLDQNQK